MESRQRRSFLLKNGSIAAILTILAGCATAPSFTSPEQPPELPAQISRSLGGKTYGAVAGPEGPIGGGNGYTNLVTSGDYVVETLEELLVALAEAQPGEVVFVPGEAEINIGERVQKEGVGITIPAGVTLAGDRGHNGSEGAVLFSYVMDTSSMITVLGENVRITGLRIEGPDKAQHREHHAWSFQNLSEREDRYGVSRLRFYSLPIARGITSEFGNLEIDNSELWGWSYSAIYFPTGEGSRIHHNYIHHNQRQGLGYGITVDRAFATIEYNLFNYNRHSIAGTGNTPSGYTARNNVVLEKANGHAFDMHGKGTREDGSIIAGTRVIIENNTFFTDRRAVGIRGRPENYARINRNWFYHSSMGEEVLIHWPPASNIDYSDNRYNAGSDTE